MRRRAARRDTPRINHAASAFIENKRYRTNPQPVDDVVNRNADSVYQTDAVLILSGAVQGRRPVLPTRTVQDEKVRRTSMFKKMSRALRGRGSFLGAGIDRPTAIDAPALPDPTVIYSSQPAQPAPARTA